MARALRVGLAVVCGLIALTFFAIFVIYPTYLRVTDNPNHARHVFSGYVDYVDVLATRRWHPPGAIGWECSYAVVALPPDAPPRPPALPENRRGQPWYWAYGGAWAETPAPPLGDTTRDALGFCAKYFSDDVNRRLGDAMAEPGSWHVVGSVGETIHVYSAPQRIAARIRYGD